jgi:hypothetical protein
MKYRKLLFETMNESVEETNRLLESGYTKNGNWSLGQICSHMTITIAASLDGYPWWMSIAAPIRPVMRALMLPKLLRGNSPKGMKTAGQFVPPQGLDDAAEVEKFANVVKRFQAHEGKLYPHPGFGKLSKKRLDHFHAMHAAHHLGFLAPKTNSQFRIELTRLTDAAKN